MNASGLAIAGLLCASAPAAGQGLLLTPSFAVSRIADDNVFYRPAGESDLTTRYSPRLDAAYDGGRLAWSGRYELDADQFDRHPELTTAHARQDAGIDLTYSASRRLSFAGTGSFVESETPIDLNLEAAPVPGRVRARRFTVQPSTTYQLGPRTEWSARYTSGGDSLVNSVGVRTDGAETAISHHVSLRTEVRVEYAVQHYRFERLDASTSQVLTAEWRRSLDRATTVSVSGGPRVTDGVLSPDLTASIHRQVRGGEAIVTYLHTTTTLLGVSSLADMHSFSAVVSAEPRPHFRIHAGPAALHTTQGTLSSAVYRLTTGLERPFAAHFALRADYDLTVQRGNIYTPLLIETIDRNRLMVTIAAARGVSGPQR